MYTCIYMKLNKYGELHIRTITVTLEHVFAKHGIDGAVCSFNQMPHQNCRGNMLQTILAKFKPHMQSMVATR